MLKNITFNLEESLLLKARKKAINEDKTLNQLFRDWVAQYLGFSEKKKSYKKLISELKYAKAGAKFSRDELNER